VPLAETLAWDNGNGDDPGTDLVGRGVVLDTVRVNRVEGIAANFCEGL
jgi:hypothetical protein